MQKTDNLTFKESFVLIDNKKILRVNISIEIISKILKDLLEEERQKGFLVKNIHLLEYFRVNNAYFVKLLIILQKASKKESSDIHYIINEYEIPENILINYFLEDKPFLSIIMGSYMYKNTKIYNILSVSIRQQKEIEEREKEL